MAACRHVHRRDAADRDRPGVDAAIPFLVLSGLIQGPAVMVINVNALSLRQAVTPDHLLGRVNATGRWIAWGTIPLGAVVGGILGTAIGLRETIAISSIGGLVAAGSDRDLAAADAPRDPELRPRRPRSRRRRQSRRRRPASSPLGVLASYPASGSGCQPGGRFSTNARKPSWASSPTRWRAITRAVCHFDEPWPRPRTSRTIAFAARTAVGPDARTSATARVDGGVERRLALDDLVDEPDPLGPDRVEPAAAGKQRPGVRSRRSWR